MIRKLFILACLVSLLSCGSQKQTSSETPVGDEESPGYSLDYSDVMEFVRGVETSYTLSGQVDGDDDSKPTIDGLPEGASYAEGLLTWKPSCDLKPENGQFVRGYMVIRVRINMESAVSDSLVQKPAIMLVHMDGEGSECEE